MRSTGRDEADEACAAEDDGPAVAAAFGRIADRQEQSCRRSDDGREH